MSSCLNSSRLASFGVFFSLLMALSGWGCAGSQSSRQGDSPAGERELQSFNGDASTMRLELVHHLLESGNADMAAPMVRAVLLENPKESLGYYYHGIILSKRDQRRLAEEAFLTALEYRPGFAPAMDKMGVLYAREGRIQEALQWHDKAIAAQSGNAAFHNNKAYTLFLAGRAEDAVAEFARAIDLDPVNVLTYNNLGFVLGRLELFSEARQAFEQAGGPIIALTNMGVVHELLGNLDEAAASYEAALQLAPGDVKLVSSVARIEALRAEASSDGSEAGRDEGGAVPPEEWPVEGSGQPGALAP